MAYPRGCCILPMQEVNASSCRPPWKRWPRSLQKSEKNGNNATFDALGCWQGSLRAASGSCRFPQLYFDVKHLARQTCVKQAFKASAMRGLHQARPGNARLASSMNYSELRKNHKTTRRKRASCHRWTSFPQRPIGARTVMAESTLEGDAIHNEEKAVDCQQAATHPSFACMITIRPSLRHADPVLPPWTARIFS